MVNIQEIEAAQQHLQGVIHQTPLDFSNTFSNLSKQSVHLKLENLQKTGSFKVRGAYNKIISLTNQQKKSGVIAASAGNHAQGVAFASQQLNIPCTIVMPENASLAKVEATKNYGADLLLYGKSFDESLGRALEVQKDIGGTFIHAFDDDEVIAGQGTIGLEILDQLDNVDVIVCPVGGGGLIAGIATAVKERRPHVKVYGVESENCASMIASQMSKEPVEIQSKDTIADGIAVKKPGKKTFGIIEKYVDDLLTVNEHQIYQAMLYLLERNKMVVEGSGAVSLAAILFNKLPFEGKNVVSVVSGGNVDIHLVSRIIEHGLVESGRFFSFRTQIPDRPGQLNKILSILAKEKANILEIHHHRMSRRIDPGQTEIDCSIETINIKHIFQVITALKKMGYQIEEKV